MLAAWWPVEARATAFGMPGWVIGAVYLVCYVVLDWVSYISPYKSFNITAWNPGTGLSFALVLLLGQRYLPLIAVAPVLGDISVLGGNTVWYVEPIIAIVIGGGYALGLSYLIQPATRFDATLSTMRDVMLLVATALVSCAGVAIVYVSILYTLGWVPAGDVVVAMRRLWVGDLIGVLVAAPLVLILATSRSRPRFNLESVLMGLSVVGAIAIVFTPTSVSHLHLFYVLFLPIIWIALRHGLEGVTLGLGLTQIGVIAGAVADNNEPFSVTALQALMMVLALTGLAIGTVVSERRRVEQQLRLNQEAVARIMLVGTMGELASAIAHEINQPLTAIANYSRVVKRHLEVGGVDRATALDAARKTVDQVERTSALIKSIRELIRLGCSEVGPVSVQKIVRDSVDLVEHVAHRAGVAVAVDMPRDLPSVLADVMQVEQALMNLLLNGIEAIEHAGSAERKVLISARQLDADEIEIAVADSGPGFAKEIGVSGTLPMKTTKPNGLGLGLALTRSIVEANGGALTIESTSHGAIARFTVPIAAEH
jgi:signal transduction histidine kinase